MIRVTVWNEFRHEQTKEQVKNIYPDGIHEAIRGFLDTEEDLTVRTAWLDQEEHGLTDEVLQDTDVLIWWAHMAHGEVSDEIAKRVNAYILKGMGAIFLHSAHRSKPFCSILGASGALTWREAGESERLWCVDPQHPIAQGLPPYIEIPEEETYGEHFDIPTPEALIYIGWYSGGDVFRSGCTWKRGYGKIFYFQPGHETFPIYHMPEVQQVIANAVRWAYSPVKRADLDCPHVKVSPEQKKARP